jgi:hypothetical protein
MVSVGIMIPTTSREMKWNSIEDSHFYKIFLTSFLKTMCDSYQYKIYLGFDADDLLYNQITEITKLQQYIANYPNISLIPIQFSHMFKKGHVTIMWNELFLRAYADNCDYYYQCGDDILFSTNGWVGKCIEKLTSMNNVGVVGPTDVNNMKIKLTQSFVSKKHMEIFGYYFPEEIINWYCDNWIIDVYSPDHLHIFDEYICKNSGGEMRYKVVDLDNEYLRYVERDKKKLINHITHDHPID